MELQQKYEIFGGIGGFILFSEMDSFDNKVSSVSWSNGSEIGTSFWFYKKGDWRLGSEVKAYYISKLDEISTPKSDC